MLDASGPIRARTSVTRHSSVAGACATRGQSMLSHSAFSTPQATNSSVPRGKWREVSDITCNIASSTMLTAKTPLSRTAASESFTPVDENITCGGT